MRRDANARPPRPSSSAPASRPASSTSSVRAPAVRSWACAMMASSAASQMPTITLSTVGDVDQLGVGHRRLAPLRHRLLDRVALLDVGGDLAVRLLDRGDDRRRHAAPRREDPQHAPGRAGLAAKLGHPRLRVDGDRLGRHRPLDEGALEPDRIAGEVGGLLDGDQLGDLRIDHADLIAQRQRYPFERLHQRGRGVVPVLGDAGPPFRQRLPERRIDLAAHRDDLVDRGADGRDLACVGAGDPLAGREQRGQRRRCLRPRRLLLLDQLGIGRPLRLERDAGRPALLANVLQRREQLLVGRRQLLDARPFADLRPGAENPDQRLAAHHQRGEAEQDIERGADPQMRNAKHAILRSQCPCVARHTGGSPANSPGL